MVNPLALRKALAVAGGMLLAAAGVFILLVGASLGWFEQTPGPERSRVRQEPGSSPALQTRPAAPTAEPSLAPPSFPPPAAPAPEADAARERLEEENRRLAGEVQDLRARLVGVLNWILTNFKGKYPLPESLMERLQVPPVTEDYTLHPELAHLFQISKDEEQKINDIFAYARAYLAEIEAALLTATSPRPDKVVLHIPPFAEHGQMLREDLYAALEITLGPDRVDRFLKVSEPGLRSSFDQFGEASRTLIFELVYASASGPPQLKIKDGWILETEPGTRTISATESTVTNFPSRYAAYRAWLPGHMMLEAVPASANP